MHHKSKFFLFLAFTIFLLTSLAGANETIKFSSLEWPPYSGENLPDQGFGIEILKAAFLAEGYSDVKVNFFPWSRALLVAEKEETYTGCLLAYYSKERAEKFIYSDPIVSGPIQFAMRSDYIIPWKKLEDLKDKKIGVVQDYINSPELDRLFLEKKLTADVSISDANNLEKLAFKRTDLAVVDKNVFIYLLKKDPALKKYQNKLQLSPRTLDVKKLYVLFSKNKNGEELVKIFNKGLKKINPQKIVHSYMKQI